MKAIDGGRVIGIALESFDETDEDGRIVILVNPGYNTGDSLKILAATVHEQNEQIKSLEDRQSHIERDLALFRDQINR